MDGYFLSLIIQLPKKPISNPLDNIEQIFIYCYLNTYKQ